MLSVVLAVLALGLGLGGTLTLLAPAGAASTMLNVALRSMLQRSVPPQLLGRIFGVLEGLMFAGYWHRAARDERPAPVHLAACRAGTSSRLPPRARDRALRHRWKLAAAHGATGRVNGTGSGTGW